MDNVRCRVGDVVSLISDAFRHPDGVEGLKGFTAGCGECELRVIAGGEACLCPRQFSRFQLSAMLNCNLLDPGFCFPHSPLAEIDDFVSRFSVFRHIVPRRRRGLEAEQEETL
jgi:hypothetical protein